MVIYPKDLWTIRVDGSNYIVQATQEQLEQLYREDKITEYNMLKVYKIKGD